MIGRDLIPLLEKMREESYADELKIYSCIIQQETLCGKALKMEHVMSTVTQTFNFARAKKAHITIIQADEAVILCGAQISAE